uniref:Plant heme peroxidase family profile domain-containing protein n=1 Tax=Aegilops tauschii subsp. strangulata TaxID=200361 RepID=A0A453PP06_AEGTS
MFGGSLGNNMMKGMVCLVAVALVVAGSASIAAAQAAGLKKGFYKKSCPQAEDIAQKVVWKHVAGNRELAAKFLRMFFHDCFVRVHTFFSVCAGLFSRSLPPIYMLLWV